MTGAEFGALGGGVDIDLLADYIGGALTGTPDESVVATLIADDPAWGDAYRELSAGMTAVGAELVRLAAEPMPVDLAERLDALLTVPVPATAGDPIAAPAPIPAELAAPPVPHLTAVRGDGAHGVPEEKTTQRARPTRAGARRRMRWATPIAIAAGVAAFAGFGLDYLSGQSAENSAGSAAQLSESQQRDSAADDAGVPPAAAAADLRILESGMDYTEQTLPDEPIAHALSAPDSGSASKQTRAAAESQALARLRGRPALQDCLDAIQLENAGGMISALSVDLARYQGAPAIIVRFTADNGTWAWASGPSCGMQGVGADTLKSRPVR
ncbi:hypothetical protein [Paractinoplanes rishiriensis]|uniref:Uncharacterized protein n=1 Tax=Paractinoplanes rishiriensis TaxID=1050105 RepID=A0A919K083_9ACTN|nr:hypothetical protein [Actinoplanes rishiriensis]GIE96454.1 hypothetical protein Ari01nite_39190 [Actinoplanes rishiriensis]